MKKTLIAIALVAIMSSCGTSRKVVKTAEVPAVAEPEPPPGKTSYKQRQL